MRHAPLGVCAVLAILAPVAVAYIEAPHTLGRCVHESSNIVLLEVEKLDRDKGLIIFKKLKDLKGKYPEAQVKHNIGKRGFHPREWQTVMAWAAVGKKAVFFLNGNASETCIGTYWYQCYREGPWWGMSHAEPFLLRTYYGDAAKLAEAVTAIAAGKEAVVPCMVDQNKQQLHERKGKVQLLKASLKRIDYNPKRDFVGFGGDPHDMPQYRTVLLLPEGAAEWKYLPASRAKIQGDAWQQTQFDDAGWSRGKAPLGYGEPEIARRKGTTVADKGQNFYFRKVFEVSGELLKGKKAVYRLSVASDDSAAVYLNGRLVDRDPAADHEFAYWNREIDLKAEYFRPGRNVLAVLVRNTTNSSDLFLDVQIAAEVELPKKAGPPVVVKNPGSVPKTVKLPELSGPLPTTIRLDRQKREVVIPCKVAPRKLPNLKEVYPIEVFATYPAPRGQKAHETVITFDGIKPSAVHRALAELGLKPGRPARGVGAKAQGPAVQLFLEFDAGGKSQRLPLYKTLVNTRTGETLQPFTWHFTGSAVRQPDPEKDVYVYGADITGTLVGLFPVTDDLVIQAGLTLEQESLWRLEVNRKVVPGEGAAVRLILKAP